jgi:EAL domain-containing protein (putative c-di-GMP-specific phosphodiesterase class I)
MAAVRAVGCDFMQGFLISEPLPPDEFIAFLQGDPPPI